MASSRLFFAALAAGSLVLAALAVACDDRPLAGGVGLGGGGSTTVGLGGSTTRSKVDAGDAGDAAEAGDAADAGDAGQDGG